MSYVKKNIKENIKIKKYIKSGGGEVTRKGERIEGERVEVEEPDREKRERK